MQDAQMRMRAHNGFLSHVHRTCGRSCMTGLKVTAARNRKRRARQAGAAAAQPTECRNARAHPLWVLRAAGRG